MTPPTPQRLYINIDHIATIRQARRGDEPDPVEAVPICERAGADGITAHLREDRRHIQDADIDAIAAAVTTVLNFEMACTPEMLDLAARLRPHQVTLVPERREAGPTAGGAALAEVEELNIGHHVISRAIFVGLDTAVRELRAAMDAARHAA